MQPYFSRTGRPTTQRPPARMIGPRLGSAATLPLCRSAEPHDLLPTRPVGPATARAARAGLAAAALLIAFSCWITACGGGSSANPAGPLDVSGTWEGTGTDSNGPCDLAFELVQRDVKVLGTVTSTNCDTRETSTGILGGTLTGQTLQGQIRGKDQDCRILVTFVAQMTRSTMTGSYTGRNECGGEITDGSFELKRR